MVPTTIVVFRKWKGNGGIIALFPELASDLYGRYCDSYEHIGQHGGADYYGVVQQTVPATPMEFARLARELQVIGYRLREIRRATWTHHERRRQTAKVFREKTFA